MTLCVFVYISILMQILSCFIYVNVLKFCILCIFAALVGSIEASVQTAQT